MACKPLLLLPNEEVMVDDVFDDDDMACKPLLLLPNEEVTVDDVFDDDDDDDDNTSLPLLQCLLARNFDFADAIEDDSDDNLAESNVVSAEDLVAFL